MTSPAFRPSPNIAQLKESATIAVSQRAKALRAAGRAIIDLGAGEPDFDTPPAIRRAAADAMDAGATRYTPTEGTMALRGAIAAQATALAAGARTVQPADVVVSNGSKQSLFNACFCLFGPGDEVLIPTPSWTSYYEMVALARATPVAVRGDPAQAFKVTVDDLARATTPRTAGLMLNSPVNPTGAVYSPAELRAILAFAESRGLWVISDEIYRRIAYEADAASCLTLAGGYERLIAVDGVAKAYAMTGWRIGWTVSAPAVARAMAAFQSHTTFGASSISQAGAVAALTGGASIEATVTAMVGKFRERRDAALAILHAAPAVTVVPPAGAFYLFIRAPDAGRVQDAGTAFASRLLEDHGVAVVPGAAFLTPDWIRASYATDLAQVEAGVRAIVTAFG